ncbi:MULTISPECIES: hypothetical protein [Allobacillus]|uniref:Uncharacterized protein n=1 Tax=Allobacillus salarius TaxID=1955272 RepID=A0A556PPU6_9BACI|nr:hypothetical protein [Allobacillus salarius]TSJ66413.1 hypothetical protein FPQ13_03930 [Allobacillus salarius]
MESENHPIVTALIVIAFLAITGGVFIGITEYEQTVVGEFGEVETTTSWIALITWVAYGIIVGILFFAMAEVIRLLHEKNVISERSQKILREVNRELQTLNKKE